MKTIMLRIVLIVMVATPAFFLALPQPAAHADQCNPGEVYCMPDLVIQSTSSDPCSDLSVANLYGLFSGTTCDTAAGLGDPEAALNNELYIPGITDVFVRMTQFAQTDAQGSLLFVFHLMSGNNVAQAPVLLCQSAQGAQRAQCAGGGEWFLGQYGLMRHIGVYVMIPMFFLMVIQSIARGSLFMLLRGALIMLPVSIFGTLALITIFQLLLNIVDDFCSYIIARATAGVPTTQCQAGNQVFISPGCSLANSLSERAFGSSNLFIGFVWAILLFAGSIGVYMELIGRQLGIYVMTLVAPLAMAAIVWGRAAGIAKLLIQWELAAIFAKIFLVGAFSLGLGAFASTNSTQCFQGANTSTVCHAPIDEPAAQDGTGGPTSGGVIPQDAAVVATNDGLQSWAVATLIMLMSMFAFAKIVTLTPAAVIATKPIWDKGAIKGRNQAIAATQANIIRGLNFLNKNRKPGNDFKTKGGDDNNSSSGNSHGPNTGSIGPNRGPNGSNSRDAGNGMAPPPPPGGGSDPNDPNGRSRGRSYGRNGPPPPSLGDPQRVGSAGSGGPQGSRAEAAAQRFEKIAGRLDRLSNQLSGETTADDRSLLSIWGRAGKQAKNCANKKAQRTSFFDSLPDQSIAGPTEWEQEDRARRAAALQSVNPGSNGQAA